MAGPEDDLLKTGEVEAAPLEPEEHETVPIDIAARTNPPQRVSVRAPTDPPTTARYSGSPEDGWLAEDTSLTRATEKALSVPAPVATDRATLTVITGLNAGQVFALDGMEHTIGRGTDADLWIEDPAVSRSHARISRRNDGRFYLEDLQSTNHCFVGGRRVEARTDLQNGDRVQIGPNLILRFAILDDAEEELQRRLYESSTRDALTRAFNRKYFGERLVAEIAHARRHKTQLGLLMMDLDRFKNVNDTYGHLAGDMVLRVVSAHVSRLIRVEDVFARYGGEEFVVLVHSTEHANASRLAERVRSTIEKLHITLQAGVSVQITASIGVSSLAELAPESGPTELIATADARLYRAKVAGRNRVCSDD